jgi:flagellar biosynthesis protein FlhG
VLLAGSGLVEYSRLTPEVREQLLDIISKVSPRFDVLLLDTGAGISDVVLFALSLAHEVIVVATPEPTSMTDAYATIKVLASQQGREQLHLVVNQVSRSGEGRGICQQLQQVVGRFVKTASGVVPQLNFMGDIPQDPNVRESVQRRSLLMELMPGSKAAQSVMQIATKLQNRGS